MPTDIIHNFIFDFQLIQSTIVFLLTTNFQSMKISHFQNDFHSKIISLICNRSISKILLHVFFQWIIWKILFGQIFSNVFRMFSEDWNRMVLCSILRPLDADELYNPSLADWWWNIFSACTWTFLFACQEINQCCIKTHSI